MKTMRAALATILIVAVVIPAVGQDPEPLTSKSVDAWLACFQDLKAWGEEREDLEGRLFSDLSMEEKLEAAQTPFSTALEMMGSHDDYDQIVELIESHGYDDPTEWANTGNRIVMAYAALKMNEQEPDMQAQMQDAIKQIEESGMSQDQKDAMKKMMGASMDFMDAYSNVPEGDLKAVEDRVETLDELLEN